MPGHLLRPVHLQPAADSAIRPVVERKRGTTNVWIMREQLSASIA